MKYIVALGNPGSKYAKNYHNLGLICATWLSTKLPHEKNQKLKSPKYELLEFEKFKLIRSLVFMNTSFEAISQIYKASHLKPANLLVMHDELMINKYDIKLKMSNKQQALGNAGHNGLRNISDNIGPNFSRLRIGIDHPKNFSNNLCVTDYVLSNIDSIEKYHQAFEAHVLDLINHWLEIDFA